MCKNPCAKDCPKRTAECHATCKEYNDFRNERNKELIRRNREQEALQTTHPTKITKIRKSMRWK